MKLDNLDHLEYSDYCLHPYIHNISTEASIGLLQVFHVELGSQHVSSIRILDYSTSNLPRWDINSQPVICSRYEFF